MSFSTIGADSLPPWPNAAEKQISVRVNVRISFILKSPDYRSRLAVQMIFGNVKVVRRYLRTTKCKVLVAECPHQFTEARQLISGPICANLVFSNLMSDQPTVSDIFRRALELRTGNPN